MSWRDALALARKGVTRRLGRAFLTVLSVALAAALLTALLTIAQTGRTEVLRQLAKGGPLAGIKVVAAAPDPAQIANDNARPGPPKDLGDDAVRAIAGLPEVDSVVPVVTSRMIFLPPDPPVRADTPKQPSAKVPRFFFETMVGVDMNKSSLLPVTLLAGRLPSAESLTEVAVTTGYLERLELNPLEPEAVLGTELEMGSPRVFESLGDQPLRAQWQRTVIVGVVAQEAAPGQVLAPIQQATLGRDWTRQSDAEPEGDFSIPTSPYSGLVVVARGLDSIGKVRTQITRIGYSTSAPENLIASVQRYLRVIEIVLASIGAIALVIASLGIASALLAAIRERRREIGVLKAIGARDRDVLRIFLIEASLIGAIGGAVGTLAGALIAQAVGSVVNGYLIGQGLLPIDLDLSPLIIAGGVIGSTVLAFAAGTVPARRAARLPAKEAMGVV